MDLYHMYLYLIIIIMILLIFITNYKHKVIDSFDNLVPDLFTYDKCCSENQIADCEKYGKTGVCNYYKNNKSCMCQNSF